MAIVGAVISKWATKRQYETGQTFPAFWAGLGLIVGATMVVFLAAGSPLDWGLPEFEMQDCCGVAFSQAQAW